MDANGIVLAATDTSLMGQTLKRDDVERSALDVTALTRRAVPGKPDLFETAAPISYAVLGDRRSVIHPPQRISAPRADNHRRSE